MTRVICLLAIIAGIFAPSAAAGAASGQCTVNVTAANLREGPSTGTPRVGHAKFGDVLDVIFADGSWIQTAKGWIYGPLCSQIPVSVYTAPETCSARVLPNGDKVDNKIDNGKQYTVTILNSTSDLCESYRIVWDGSAIRQDRLPPEGQRTPFERDFTGWWDGPAHFAGVSCTLWENVGNKAGQALTPVFDYDDRQVGSSHGVQHFEFIKGRWYLVKCQGTWNPGFRINVNPWTRP